MIDRDDRYFPKKWPHKRPSRLWAAVKSVAPYLLIAVVICGTVYWFAAAAISAHHSRHLTSVHPRSK
jgi:hypothetical protein